MPAPPCCVDSSARYGCGLSHLLELALPFRKNADAIFNGGGALLALSAHCVMINEGFSLANAVGDKASSAYCPPDDWNDYGGSSGDLQGYQGFWVFEYVLGRSKRFVMSCSLHVCGKLFVHAREADNHDDVQVLALKLKQYISGSCHEQLVWDATSGQLGWDDVIVRQDLLYDMCMEYICGPLISLSQASVLPVRVSGLIEMSAELVADETDAYFSPRVDLTRREVEEACTVHQITWSKRSSSTIASEMKEMLNSAPAFIMLPVIMATTAAAATAVFWAWRR